LVPRAGSPHRADQNCSREVGNHVMPAFRDLTGQRFGRLVVIGLAPKKGIRTRWNCHCDCGQDSVASSSDLRTGDTSSCGCLMRQRAREAHTVHGDTTPPRTPEYRTWQTMLTRCRNPKRRDFKDYGGRGITVCERWAESYQAFLADVGRRPSPKHSIDRYPDNDGNYEPGNVRWATRSEQARNQRPRRRARE
jgi:hypothetical protein